MPQFEPYPFQLLRDMLRTYWDTTKIPRPHIIEAPPPDYVRADLYNYGPHIVVNTGELQEELIHVGFQNLDITVPMELAIYTAGAPEEMGNTEEVETNRERHRLLYDYAREVQRIILTNQHDPNVYLFDNFEWNGDNVDTGKWSGSGLSISTDQQRYGTRSLQIDNSAGMTTLPITASLPGSIQDIDDVDSDGNEVNPLPLIPRPGDRLAAIKFSLYTENTEANKEIDVTLNGTNILNYTLPMGGENNEWLDFFIDLMSIDNITDNTNSTLVFTIPTETEVWVDQVVFSTCEYQMLLYQGFRPDNETFGIYVGVVRANFRSVGDSIDRLM